MKALQGVVTFTALLLCCAYSNEAAKIFHIIYRPSEVEKVKLEVYVEALCPDCKDFFRDQLVPVWKKIGGETGIFTVDLYPYGNAAYDRNADGTFTFRCQHGPLECAGNTYETCLIHRAGNSDSQFMPVIACMENATNPVAALKSCITSDFDYQDIKTCAEGPEGNRLEYDMARATESLNPPHQYVPWIALNGVHTEELNQNATTNLLKLICDAYSGPKPIECRN